MSEQHPDDIQDQDAAQSREAADQLRRRLLKTGAAAVPVIISLQSGTAWALSSCASTPATGVKRPTRSQLINQFGDFTKSPNSTQQLNRQTVTSLTGIKDKKGGKNNYNDIESIVQNFSGSGGGFRYPEGPGESVETGDMIHLMVTNGSCWTSYCNGPIRGTRDVYVYSDTSPSVCG
jgi:hypothetical protein